ncbi:MAG: MFS transporter [Chloroflexota bacterium]
MTEVIKEPSSVLASEIVPNTPLAPTLIALTLARLMINGARRFPYVILTPMAAALGVPRSTLEATLSVLWATGAISPFTGAFIDRIGRKRMMLIGVGSLAVLAGIAALGTSANVVLFVIVASGIAKTLYDPALQAYIGDRTSYSQRGMAIGITELAWSGSLFILGPLAAFLIVQVSLGAIYGVIAAGSVLSFFLILKVIQKDAPVTSPDTKTAVSTRALYRSLFASRPAIVLLLTALLMDLCIEQVSIVYEVWLRDTFTLTTIVLGSLAWVLSTAEVAGEGLVIAISDRFGKRRLLILALAATGFTYLLLPISSGNVGLAIANLFLLFLCFETSIVAFLPIATEVLPQARGTMMSASIAAFSVGRALGTLLGGWLFRTGGIGFNGVVGWIVSMVVVVLVWRFVTDAKRDEPPTLIEHSE